MSKNEDKIQSNLILMDELRNYENEEDGFVIIYIVDDLKAKENGLLNSYYINETNNKVEELWKAKIFKTENEAIFASKDISLGGKVTSTVIAPVSLFVYDAIEKLKAENKKLLS